MTDPTPPTTTERDPDAPKPAAEFVAELLAHTNAAFAEMFTDRQARRAARNVDPADTIEVLEAAVTVYRWGFIYALLALRRCLPPVLFDDFTRDVQQAFAAGDSLGEWSWQWADELARGVHPTLPYLIGRPKVAE